MFGIKQQFTLLERRKIYRNFLQLMQNILRPFKFLFKRTLVSEAGFYSCKLSLFKFCIYNLAKRHIVFCYFEESTREENISGVPSDWLVDPGKAVWRGISLEDPVIYSVCVECMCFRDELDLTNSQIRESLKTWFARAISETDRLMGRFERTRPHHVIVFQGHFLTESIIRKIAIQRNIEILSLEMTAHKDRLLRECISGISVNQNISRSVFWRYRDSISSEIPEEFVENDIKFTKQSKQNQHQSPDITPELPQNKLVFLFLGQVYTDSSQLFGLKGFNNPIQVLKTSVFWAIEHGLFPVIKLHPKEFKGTDPVGHREYNRLTFRKLIEDSELAAVISSENVLVDENNQYDTYGLINRSKIVMTVNSQAGLEAAIRGKPVVVNSGAFYSGLEFTWDFSSKRGLISALDDALFGDNSKSDERQKSARMFYYVYSSVMCIPRTIRGISDAILNMKIGSLTRFNL